MLRPPGAAGGRPTGRGGTRGSLSTAGAHAAATGLPEDATKWLEKWFLAGGPGKADCVVEGCLCVARQLSSLYNAGQHYLKHSREAEAAVEADRKRTGAAWEQRSPSKQEPKRSKGPDGAPGESSAGPAPSSTIQTLRAGLGAYYNAVAGRNPGAFPPPLSAAVVLAVEMG